LRVQWKEDLFEKLLEVLNVINRASLSKIMNFLQSDECKK